MSQIAKNITSQRKLKGLSQDGLANDLGITRSRLGSYEEGRCEPPYYLLIKIADYFELTIDTLIREKNIVMGASTSGAKNTSVKT